MANKTLLLTASANVGVGFWTSICCAFAKLGGVESKNFSKKMQRVMNNVKKRLQEQMDQLEGFEFHDFRMVQNGNLSYTGTIIAIGPEENIPENFKVNFYNAWERKQEPQPEVVVAPVMEPEPMMEQEPQPEPQPAEEPQPEPVQEEPAPVEEPAPAPQPEPEPIPQPSKRFCPQCGQEVEANAMFCTCCGSRLEPAPAPAPQPQPFLPNHEECERLADEGKYYYNEVKDYNRAFDCFYRAAAGSLRARCNLGYLCYYLGHGVKKNKKLAIQVLEECVANGYEPAQAWLDKVKNNK